MSQNGYGNEYRRYRMLYATPEQKNKKIPKKYEKGINGVSATRLLQLSNYLKVPVSYFFDNYAEYSANVNKTVQEYISVNYAFLAKIYSEMTQEQKSKFLKMTAKEVDFANIKTG